MGNNIVVCNKTSEEIIVRIYYAGSDKNVAEELVAVHERKNISFAGKFYGNKTVIVDVNDKTMRAVRISSELDIIVNSFGALQIDILNASRYALSSTEVVENIQQSVVWNLTDGLLKIKTVEECNKASELLNGVSKNIAYLFGGIVSSGLGDVVGNRDVGKMSSKMMSDVVYGYLHMPKFCGESDKSDDWRYQQLEVTRCNLMALMRIKSMDYEFYKAELSEEKKLDFLNRILNQLTYSECLPFLEHCGLPEAVPLYIIMINFVLDLFGEIRLLRKSDNFELEKKYIGFFMDNVEQMLTDNLGSINAESRVRGWLMKRADLRHNGEIVYRISGLNRQKMIRKMEAVKCAFVENRKYQMEWFLGSPRDFIERYKQTMEPKQLIEP